MSEPNTGAAALSGVAASSLAVLFPQYLWIIAGGLAGSIYALSHTPKMTRLMAVWFIVRCMCPTIVFSGFVADTLEKHVEINARDAFSIVAYMIAVYHQDVMSKAKDLLLNLIPSRVKP